MKIGIDSRSINLHRGSGIGTYTYNLVLNLINNNPNDNFNLIWTGEDDKDFIKDNSEFFITSGRFGGFYESFYVPTIMNELTVDLYHIPQNGIGFPFDFDINTVVTIHDLIPYVMPETVGRGYLNRFLKDMPYIIESAKGILTVSEYSKQDILKFFPSFPKEKIFVTPLATNSNYKPLNKAICKKYIKDNYTIDDNFILYIGGFSKRKNVKELILSFASVKAMLNTPHKLIIGGSLRDEGEQLKDMVYEMKLDKDVLFVGYLDDTILPIFYSAAEVFAYPSLYEGFGLPPLEAMSCNTAVITSNLTSIPEVTKDSALLIDPYNTNELSTALITILNNEYTKKNLAEKGYSESKKFSWEKTASLTREAYNSIITDITI